MAAIALLMTAALSACDGDEPSSVSEPATQPQHDAQRQTAPQVSAPREDADRSPDLRTTAAFEIEREEAPPVAASDEARAAPESEQQSSDAVVQDSVGVEAEEQEPAEPPQGLTELPGAVVEDTDIRVRPGLAWGAIDRLKAGASVVVLHGPAVGIGSGMEKSWKVGFARRCLTYERSRSGRCWKKRRHR
ncbi:MAG: hypothetical protein OXD50_03010 [Chloroflexi bacterium]|nr:hypothetical protein [Chloroflexota bacterium]